MSHTPWLNRGDRLRDIVHRYSVDDWLPGGIPLAALNSWNWRNQFASCDRYLYLGFNRSIDSVRFEIAMTPQLIVASAGQ